MITLHARNYEFSLQYLGNLSTQTKAIDLKKNPSC
jgi:hypothetical protein